MTEPERALEQARATAAAMRADGAYGEDPQGGELAPADAPTPEKLFEWALIDPDLRQVRSVRLLGQYHAELIAEQARFNVNLVRYVRRLEERVAALEGRLGGASGEEGEPAPPPE